ncbi:hypothetical protein [Pseudomonas sp. UM16]|uniref:hypothetical protein n=1 Tax=Pseudomonas sp. UM16 TaxID=3158962 RepID=UPI00398FB925
MKNLEERAPSYEDHLKLISPSKKAKNPESLLYAHTGNYYPTRSFNQRVSIRFIELTGPDTAIITIRTGNEFYSTTVSRDAAYANSETHDIIVENGQFRYITEKIVSDTNKPVELITYEIPSDILESGENHPIALYAPKNTVIRITGTLDTVKYRTLHHLEDGTSKFVIRTIGNKVFEHSIDTRDFGTLALPGDFVVYENTGYVSLVTMRTMPFDNYIREETAPIVLSEES